MLDQLHTADPGASYVVLRDRALGQLMSGVDQAVMTSIADPLVKIVPAGKVVSQTFPYVTMSDDLDAAAANGTGPSNQFGLPSTTKSSQYDIYQFRPQGSQNVYVSNIAPSTVRRLDGLAVHHARCGTRLSSGLLTVKHQH